MTDPFDLHRFITAQDSVFETVLAELRAGAKASHWMWFIFPQLRALGRSSTAQYYGLASIDEARAYFAHPLLGSRLRECIGAIMPWTGKRAAEQILGETDAIKLRSCLTLFEAASAEGLFGDALDSLYFGQRDEHTLALLNPRR